MKTVLRKVGNSRGVLIPAMFLAGCQIGDELELTEENGRLVIVPVAEPRAGWFDAVHGAEDADAWEGVANLADDSEWEW